MTDRTVKIRLTGDISDFNRAMLEAAADAKAFNNTIDSSTDRMANLTQTALALGPALVPISAAAIPAMAGLTNQLGIGAAGVGVLVLAFHGLGKALDAVNSYQLEPTTENFQKMEQTLSSLGPAGEDFVLFLQRARPEIQHLQALAQQGLFPGIEQGLHSLTGLLPNVESIITTISSTLGDLSAEAGANLNTPEWRKFFDFLDQQARPTLIAMGETAGNFAKGLANLWMAFAPLENNFSQGFLGLARDFAKWTDGLDKTQGFQEFLAYVDRVGPKAWSTLGALANALLQIVEAAAPVGEATLPIITALADAIGALANSDLGPVIIGVVALASALGRLKAIGGAANSGAIGGLLGNSGYTGVGANIKAEAQAMTELRVAQDKLAVSAVAARDAQFALIPTGAKRQALAAYRTDLLGVAKAEETAAAATRSRNAQFGKIAGGSALLALSMSGLDKQMGLTNTVTLAMAGSLIGPWGTALGAGIGLVKDFAAQGDNATEKIKNLIEQVNAAGPLSQHDLFDIQTTGTNLVTDDKSAKALDDLYAALDRNKQKAQDAAFAEAGLAAQMDGASQSTRDETYALLENIATKNKAADAADNAFSAETNYRRALKDAEKQARTNKAGIDGSSEAALKNRDSLSQLAGAWNQVADAGKASKKDLVNARADFIKVAESFGIADDAAIALADTMLHKLPVKPKVDVDDKASPKVSALQDRINGLHGKTVTINTRYTYTNAGNAARDAASVRTHRGNAEGGYITGPGTTTSDSIPAWLSDQEYVIKAASVQKYGKAMFDMLNAGTFANGGLVQRFLPPNASANASAPPSGVAGLSAADLKRTVSDGIRQGMEGITIERPDNRTLRTKIRRGG